MNNFDLKKFLKESKALENLNPSIKSLNENELLREKIKEMIVAELADPNDYDYEEEDLYGDYKNDDKNYYVGVKDSLDTPPEYIEDEIEEAKKKEEDVEDVEITDEMPADETPADEMPDEETPVKSGGLEDIAADMKGTEGDLMDHLMKAFQISKGMNNEKLETQIGNTLKFFVSEYIGGGEQ